MKSRRNEEFRKHFADLPASVQNQARRVYKVWQRDPSHPSLHFKSIHASLPLYSVRIGLHYRAVGLKRGDAIIWFWIGPHAAYDTLLKKL